MDVDHIEDWRLGITATTRLDNVLDLQKRGYSHHEAFQAENKAFTSAESLIVYRGNCRALCDATPITNDEPDRDLAINEMGRQIGEFRDCRYVASGLTSEVYRSKSSALKVILEVRNVEPHSGLLERKVLASLRHPNIIQLLSFFLDESQHLVLELPFLPYTLGLFIESHDGPIASSALRCVCIGLFEALRYLHEENLGLIHRDVKPSNILLSAMPPTDPSHVKLIDFGTCWHPELSSADEPEAHKVLEIGTSCYRAPETLFANRSYTSAVDIWSAGCILVECIRPRHESLFLRYSGEENGNQLALITSIFQTIGTPSETRWPEAKSWKTNPFGMWKMVPGKQWRELLGAETTFTQLIERCVVFQSSDRITAGRALQMLAQ